jgi:hypothetical protein
MLMLQSPIDADDNLVIIAPVWLNIAAGVTIMGDEPRLVSVGSGAGRPLAARRSSGCGRFSISAARNSGIAFKTRAGSIWRTMQPRIESSCLVIRSVTFCNTS